MKTIRLSDTTIAVLLALSAFAVYVATCAPHLGTEDPGEIATALNEMGILHPTGYPLYTLIGSLITRVPFGESVIVRLNLFGAVLTALATFFFYGTFRSLFGHVASGVFKPRNHDTSIPEGAAESDSAARAGAAVATLVFAFSAVYWSEAVWVEVYALHLVFLAVVTRLFVSSLASPHDHRRWLLFAYVLGLSFAHHMMTVLLAPAFLTLFFQVHGFGRGAWMRIARAAPPFLLALTAYLYLPIRSAAGPLMNWGEPTTPAALWAHVRGAQYSGQMFASLEVAQRKLLQFTVDLPGDFGYAPLALAALGLWALRRTPRLLVFTVLIFVTGLIYAINYGFDDPNFHLNPHFALALAAGFGAAWWLKIARGTGRVSVGLIVGVIALCPLAFNYAKLDKSRDTLVEDYARNVLMSMGPRAVLFTHEYERLGSPAFYLQNVEGFRSDVTVLDIILLGNPWYYGHLEKRDPWLVQAVRPELEAFRADLSRFQKSSLDSASIRTSLTAFFHAIIARSAEAGRPVYVTSGVNPELIDRYQHAPTGMVFRLLDQNDTTRVRLREPLVRVLPERNPLTPTIRSEYAQSYAYQGAYLAQWGDTAKAIRFMRRALQIQPHFPAASAYLRELQLPPSL
jgi:hypothetical protein